MVQHPIKNNVVISINEHEAPTNLLLRELDKIENKINHKPSDRRQYINILKELYNRYPNTYFRMWYFFKTQKNAAYPDWNKWKQLYEYLDSYYRGDFIEEE